MSWSSIRKVLVRDLGAVQSEISAYPDEESLWRVPAGIGNSAGTLALHLAGNLQHFVGHHLGGTGYVRDRPGEFAERRSRSEIVAELERAQAVVDETLRALPAEAAERPFPERFGGRELSVGQFVTHLATHLAYHLGQIDYHRRLLTPEAGAVRAVAIPDLFD